MFTILRQIAVIGVVVAYATATQATSLRLTEIRSTSAGPLVLKEQTKQGNGKRHVIWTQRRHLPMVSQLSLSPVEPPQTFVPEVPHKFSCAMEHQVLPVLLFDYYSSRCNKAPPLL
jgi:hypothetical protein